MKYAALVIFVFAAGMATGYKLGGIKYTELLLTQANELNAKIEAQEAISNEYYDKYQAAINRPASVVTQRVYVRTTCPATNPDTAMGEDGGEPARAELHEETVRSVTAVTDNAERDVLKCRAALKSLIGKVEQ